MMQQSESGKSQSKPFQGAMDKVGAGLIKLGEDLKGAGEHLGGVFVGLGNKLRGTMYVTLSSCKLCCNTSDLDCVSAVMQSEVLSWLVRCSHLHAKHAPPRS